MGHFPPQAWAQNSVEMIEWDSDPWSDDLAQCSYRILWKIWKICKVVPQQLCLFVYDPREY